MLRGTSLILLNTVLLAALAECAARVAEFAYPRQDEVSFEYAPYRMLRMSRAPWPLNREGFRAQELDQYRGKFVVEFLGGSVCVGVGTDAGKTLPERLEDALAEVGLRAAAVVNLCQGGATSAQELAIFLEYGLPLRPQVVLSFDGANDLLHPLPLGQDASENLPYRDREMRAGFAGDSWTSHLALARVASRMAQRWLKPMPAESSAVRPEAILDSYVYTLEVVRTLTSAGGGWHAVLLQPTLHYNKPWSEEERAMWQARRPRDSAAASHYAAGLYEQARARLAGRGDFYDLTQVFAATPATMYSDSVHFTGATGYRMLAEELERQGLIGQIVARYKHWEAAVRPERSTAWRQ
jgi:hypothetical protein